MVNYANISPSARAAWDALNATWGDGLTPTSAYRDPSYNASVGGARGSQHMHGNAFDVSTSGMTPEDRINLAKAALAAGFSGIGAYDGSMHFDVGPSRAWGADYTNKTAPDWLREIMAGRPSASTKGVGNMEQQQAGLLAQFHEANQVQSC